MPEEKKNLFNKAIDALTDRDEKAAAAKAAAEKAAAEKAAAAKAAADKVAAAKVAAQKAATDKAAFAKAGADKAASDRASAIKAGAERAASMKAAADKATAARVAAAAAAPKKGIVMVRSLHIRKDHITTSAEVGGLTKDKEVTILETWTDGKNSWGKLGPDQWAAIVYNGETLIKLS
jgi:hypothetical protein